MKRPDKPRVFRIGDRVVIVRSHKPERVGQVATIVSALELSTWVEDGPNALAVPMHTLDLRPLPRDKALGAESVSYPPDHLEPYRDDGNERGRWTRDLRKLCGRVEVKS